MKKETKIVYIDGTDWYHEVGETDATTWPSKESILERTPCARQCGVVKCEIKELEWVHPSSIYSSRQDKFRNKKQRIAIYQKHIDAYLDKIQRYKTLINQINSEKIVKCNDFTITMNCDHILVESPKRSAKWSKVATIPSLLSATSHIYNSYFYTYGKADEIEKDMLTEQQFKDKCKEKFGIEF